MNIPILFIIVAVLCAAWSGTSVVLMTAYLSKRGIQTPWPLVRFYALRNIHLYRKETLKADGKVGMLFYLFVIPMNAVWILLLLAFAFL